MENKKQDFAPGFNSFLHKFIEHYVDSHSLKSDNDKTINSVLLYEKLRTAIEYQEDHLIFKNAIARILRRKYALSPGINPEQLLSDLLSELAWANYINPESLETRDHEKLAKIVGRYLTLLQTARSGRFKRHELQRLILDWCACEIDAAFRPDCTRDILIDYTCSIIKQNLVTEGARASETDNEMQLKISIYGLIFKPDYPLIQFWVINKIYPEWTESSEEEIAKTGRSFDPFYNKIDHALNHPLRKSYLQYTKRYIAPFILLYSVLTTKKLDLEKLKTQPNALHNMLMEEYTQKVAEVRKKVWGGTFRALIFILLTKISLAFIIEIPFDRLLTGVVDLTSLIINISLPPFLMFAAGTFIKSPPAKNYQIISGTFNNIAFLGKTDDRHHTLIPKKNHTTELIFNSVYFAFTLAILSGVIYFLIALKFNIVSIFFFFFFISIVSFFSFRIRNLALELAMKRSRDDALTSVLEFLLLPFIRIGKFFSDKFAVFNPFILALDFLIEAPLKTVIKILNSWLRFINAKKEELEY